MNPGKDFERFLQQFEFNFLKSKFVSQNPTLDMKLCGYRNLKIVGKKLLSWCVKKKKPG
jgi:hypothetical protein